MGPPSLSSSFAPILAVPVLGRRARNRHELTSRRVRTRAFALAERRLVDSSDHPGVVPRRRWSRADLPGDIRPDISGKTDPIHSRTIGRSPTPQDHRSRANWTFPPSAAKWETTSTGRRKTRPEVVRRAFVIAGRDSAATIYGPPTDLMKNTARS